jgi:Domain of unknown function (DUF1992)
MDRWESLVEQKIREAMEAGEFDNLPGKGRPVDTSENPFEDPDLRLAHRLLRDAGFAPPWIEERKDIDAEFERARSVLARARALCKRKRQSDPASAEASWQHSITQFREQVAALNHRINSYNLSVPAAAFQRRQIQGEQVIERILQDE